MAGTCLLKYGSHRLMGDEILIDEMLSLRTSPCKRCGNHKSAQRADSVGELASETYSNAHGSKDMEEVTINDRSVQLPLHMCSTRELGVHKTVCRARLVHASKRKRPSRTRAYGTDCGSRKRLNTLHKNVCLCSSKPGSILKSPHNREGIEKAAVKLISQGDIGSHMLLANSPISTGSSTTRTLLQHVSFTVQKPHSKSSPGTSQARGAASDEVGQRLGARHLRPQDSLQRTQSLRCPRRVNPKHNVLGAGSSGKFVGSTMCEVTNTLVFTSLSTTQDFLSILHRQVLSIPSKGKISEAVDKVSDYAPLIIGKSLGREVRSTVGKPVERLPTEIMGKLADMLPGADVFKMCITSRQICRLTTEGCQRLSLAGCKFEDRQSFYLPGPPAAWLDEPRFPFSNLTGLDLSRTFALSDSTLTFICENAPKLEHLNLSGCYRIGVSGTRAIAENLPSLKTLDLSYCASLTDYALAILVSAQLNLVTLSLLCCSRLTDGGIQKVACLPKLQLVDLSYTHVSGLAMESLLFEHPSLRLVSVVSAPLLSRVCLFRLLADKICRKSGVLSFIELTHSQKLVEECETLKIPHLVSESTLKMVLDFSAYVKVCGKGIPGTLTTWPDGDEMKEVSDLRERFRLSGENISADASIAFNKTEGAEVVNGPQISELKLDGSVLG